MTSDDPLPTTSRAAARARARAGRTLAALTAWLGAGACAPPSPAATGDALQPARLGSPALAGLFVGCWAMTWDLERGGPADVGPLPDSVSLRDSGVFGSGERLVSPATHPTARRAGPGDPVPWEARYRLNRWWVEGDSLRLRFSDGAGDEWLVWLGEQGEGLVGRGAAGGSGGSSARVRAASIACDFG